ncbi:hypothetical protein HJG60_011017 [Phyllostomus discolor]|uniref:Uncharacterized protein n=1 Tax=Phyllostomus discolor TaxID=89673 RepID=A0A834EAF4_9CHIR|nr:hypothetical protein HJG60_011017 [Phyllostomus discolor]
MTVAHCLKARVGIWAVQGGLRMGMSTACPARCSEHWGCFHHVIHFKDVKTKPQKCQGHARIRPELYQQGAQQSCSFLFWCPPDPRSRETPPRCREAPADLTKDREHLLQAEPCPGRPRTDPAFLELTL